MEGFCRASSPLSIADCRTRFNAKWPENLGFSYNCVICPTSLRGSSRLKYLTGEGLSAPGTGCPPTPTIRWQTGLNEK
jgi:hypothetical protein